MELTKQRFQCPQCNLIWETLVHPYTKDQKGLRIEFDVCPDPNCKSENIKELPVKL